MMEDGRLRMGEWERGEGVWIMGEGRRGVDDGRLRMGEGDGRGCVDDGGREKGGGNDGGRETICDESEEGMRGVRRGMEDGRREEGGDRARFSCKSLFV